MSEVEAFAWALDNHYTIAGQVHELHQKSRDAAVSWFSWRWLIDSFHPFRASIIHTWISFRLFSLFWLVCCCCCCCCCCCWWCWCFGTGSWSAFWRSSSRPSTLKPSASCLVPWRIWCRWYKNLPVGTWRSISSTRHTWVKTWKLCRIWQLASIDFFFIFPLIICISFWLCCCCCRCCCCSPALPEENKNKTTTTRRRNKKIIKKKT